MFGFHKRFILRFKSLLKLLFVLFLTLLFHELALNLIFVWRIEVIFVLSKYDRHRATFFFSVLFVVGFLLNLTVFLCFLLQFALLDACFTFLISAQKMTV